MEFIGQLNNKELVRRWGSTNTLPRTMIISGTRGCGKKMFAQYIAQKFGLDLRWAGNKVGDSREVIQSCQSLSHPTMFVFVNADDMTLAAKNSLLKILEEPPTDAYFVVLLEDAGNTLPTIVSRAIEVPMEPYCRQDLEEFTSDETCLEIATNPGQVKELVELGVDNLVNLVEKVIDNIDDVSVGNALNISKNIRFKDDDTGFDLEVFWRVFLNRVVHYLRVHIRECSMGNVQTYQRWMSVTQRYINQVRNRSLNKKMLFDMWVFDIRNEVR